MGARGRKLARARASPEHRPQVEELGVKGVVEWLQGLKGVGGRATSVVTTAW